MDLKALTAALFVAFITVIMDAVFNFHYIYVLAILVITSYVLVRLISIASSQPHTPPKPAPSAKKPLALTALLQAAAKEAGISLEMDTPITETAEVNGGKFQEALTAAFKAFGTKTHGKADTVRSGKGKMVHLILRVNRKATAFQKELDTAVLNFQSQLSGTGGTVWQVDIPRKTELHILIPGS